MTSPMSDEDDTICSSNIFTKVSNTFPFILNGTYECTINPINQKQYFSSGSNRFKNTCEAFFKFISNITSIKYSFIPEISRKGRIHFHGTVTVTDMADFSILHLHKFYEGNYNTCFNPYRNDYWPRYISKDIKMMAPISSFYNIPYFITPLNISKYNNLHLVTTQTDINSFLLKSDSDIGGNEDFRA